MAAPSTSTPTRASVLPTAVDAVTHAAPALPLREVVIEGALLGVFMVSACGFGTLLEANASPIPRLVPDPHLRRALMGAAMGFTAIALIYSRWGRRSGAHMNPAVTLTFLKLGRIHGCHALAYVVAQLAGAALAVLVMARVLGAALAEAPVRYVVTTPGAAGAGAAFMAELVISSILMLVVLETSAHARLARWTGVAAGLLIATWITFEAPISGMSMNPARTFGSALAARDFTYFWIYAIAPPLGMLVAAKIHARWAARAPAAGAPVACAKLHHPMNEPCIFCAARARRVPSSTGALREPFDASRHSQAQPRNLAANE